MKRLSVSIIVVMITLLMVSNVAICSDKKQNKKNSNKQTQKDAQKQGQNVDSAEKTPNAAIVNGVTITKETFEREYSLIKKQLESMGNNIDSSKLAAFRDNILDNLIGAELLFQESAKQGIKVEDGLVDTQIKQMSSQFKTEEEFNAALKEVGLTKSIITAQVRRGLAIKLLIDKLYTNKIVIADKEQRDFYEQNPTYFKRPEQIKASHILLKTEPADNEKTKADKKAKLEVINARLKKGEDFATLAKDNSDCPSKTQGGDLGYFGRGQMAKPFEDAAFALKVGELSPIVETQFGYHIIKLAEKKPASTVPFDEVKEKIKEQLTRKKIQTEVALMIEKLKEKAKIEKVTL
jgi:peptidyl-prolyl cis-trans isomerase C